VEIILTPAACALHQMPRRWRDTVDKDIFKLDSTWRTGKTPASGNGTY
jgi:hypothetical protein